MNTPSLKVIAATLLLSAGVTAHAGMITDVVDVNTKLNWLEHKSWTHDLNDDGFVLGSAISGKLSIQFWDDSNDSRFFPHELATVIVGVIDFADGALIYNPTSDLSQNLGINSLAGLNGSGELFVKVWSDLGDFHIGQSTLEVVTQDTREVPEPASLGLIGLGLVALTLARRKN